MLHIWVEDKRIHLAGRFDHLQGQSAEAFFREVKDSRVLDFKELEYISSAGIGILLQTQKRLRVSGHGLKIVNASNHIRDVFGYAGLTEIFQIE